MLYKRGKVWWIRIKHQGNLIRRSTGSSSKELARRIELEIQNELAEGTWFERDLSEITLFHQVWKRYLDEEGQYKARGSYMRDLQCAKNFLPVIGNLTLKEITPSVLSSYKVRRFQDNVAVATVLKELQAIRRVFSLCKKHWQLIKHSPFEYFTMPQANDRRVRYLGQGEFEKLLSACPYWLKPIVVLAKYTGMRRGNILELTWSQVDLENHLLNLDRTKNGQRLIIPLTDSAYHVLNELKRSKVVRLNCPYVFHEDGKPISPYRVSVAFKRASRRAEIENFRFHDLRHDFASQLVQNGNELYVVQSLLGHKDGRMTQRYAHLKVENLRDAVKTLEGGTKRGTVENEKGVTEAVTP